jgi:hypothetical protein
MDSRELCKRVVKLLTLGLVVAFAALLLGRSKNMEEALMLALIASAMYGVLEQFAPNIADNAKLGTGFALGSALVGGL